MNIQKNSGEGGKHYNEAPKNRWGSMTKQGSINLNINLLKAPEDVIDYNITRTLPLENKGAFSPLLLSCTSIHA
jgi:Protein of unknown function DUF45